MVGADEPQEVLYTQHWLICATQEYDPETAFGYYKAFNDYCLDDGSFDTYHHKAGEFAAECKCRDGVTYTVSSDSADIKKEGNRDYCVGGEITKLIPDQKNVNNMAFCGNSNGVKRQAGFSKCAYEVIMKFGQEIKDTKHGHHLRGKTTRCVESNENHSDSGYQQYSYKRIKNAGIYSHPSLIVNGKAVYGSLSAENAFNAVCEAFIDPPATCAYVKNKWVMNEKINEVMMSHTEKEQHFWFTNIIVLLIIFSIAGGVFYVVFKKMYKNIIATQIQGMVRESVQNYNKIDDL